MNGKLSIIIGHLKYIIPFLILAVGIYVYQLDKAPVHLNQDELGFSLNAYSIAKTGYDENGRYLPLYFWHLGLMWATPVIVYLTSAILTVLPISETTVRLSSVIIGITNSILIYFIALKILKSKLWAAVTAVVLITTPAHVIQSRVLLDNLYPVPFLLGWFLSLLSYKESKKGWKLLIAALLLGIGVHSYHAAKIMMPLFLFATFPIVFREIKKEKKLILYIISGFIIPLLPLIPWLQKYPDTLTDQVKYVGLYDTKLNPLQGLLTLLTPETLINRFEVYVSYFNPDFLFFKGDAHLVHSTAEVGVFLIPLLVLIPVGIYQSYKRRDWIGNLIIFGFFAAPVAAAFVGNQYRISKSLLILPFGVFLSVLALRKLTQSHVAVEKFVGYLCIVLMAIQFTFFYSDYLGKNRERTYSWFNYDIPGVLEALIKEDNARPAKSIYLDQHVWFIDRYWRFYTLKHDRSDLLIKTVYFDPITLERSSLPQGILLMYRFDHSPKKGIIEPQITITEPDGMSSYYVYRK